MISNGCVLSSGVSHSLQCKRQEFGFRSHSSTISGIPQAQRRVASSCGSSSWNPLTKIKPSSKFGIASTPFLHGEESSPFHTIPKLPDRRILPSPPRASTNTTQGFSFPPMTKKPRFWWRILACLPYIMPFHETWMYAETAYHLHPFLEDFEFLTYPFLRSLGRLPRWFLIAYFFVGYLGVVRRKEWPHFFRFHVVTGMLLEILLQTTGYVSRWMPLGLYWGKIGMHFWVFFAFAFMFTVIECMRCAICGMYADIPFVSGAAYIQIPFDQK